jgi:hypothetical protein
MNVYADMDGVSALFEKASLEEMTSKGFFASRKPVLNVIEFFRLLSHNKSVNLFILSSVLSDMAEDEKREWNKEWMPFIKSENQIYIPYGVDKAEYLKAQGIAINNDDILVDDFSLNLHSWHGVGVKMYNGINGNHGTWKGYSLHSNMAPDIMYKQMVGICFAVNLQEQYINISNQNSL